MAEEEITKVYNVEIKATEALKEVAALTLQSKELREEQKKLDTSTEEGRLQYAKYGEQIKAINARARERQKEIQNTIKAQNAEKASLEALRTQLSLDTAALAKLGDTEANAAKRDALQQRIKATSDELKRQEEAYGDHRRSVGDYQKATRDLGAELSELIKQLAELRAQGKQNTEEYANIAKEATNLKNAVDNVNAEIANGAKNTSNIDALTQSVQGLVGVMGIYQSVSALVGDENEDVVKTIQQLQIVTTALASITAIQNSLLKESIVYQKSANIVRALGINQEARAAKAQALALVLKKQDIGVTKLVTAAQWLWNAALAANPVMLIVTGVGLLIGGVVLLTDAFDDNAKSAKAAAEAQKEYESSVERTNIELERIERRRTIQQNKARVNAEEEITLMRENGYTAEEIAKRRAKAEEESAKIEIRAAQDRINANIKERSEAEANLKIQQKVLFGMSEKHKKYKEQKQIVDDLTKSIRDLDKEISTDQTLVQIAAIDARNKQLDEQEEAEKKAFDLAVKFSERRQSLQEASLKAESDYQKEDYATKVAYESRIQLLQLNGEKERLAIQLRYKKITTAEYAAQIKILEDNYRAFQNAQVKNMNEYFKSVRDSLFDMAGKTVDEQIDDITKKYEKAFKELKNQAATAPQFIEGMDEKEWEKIWDEYNDFLLAEKQLELRLQKAQEKEIADIRYNARQKSKNDIDTLIDREYEDDLAKFSDNEREKLRIEAEIIQKRIEERKKAGLETGDLEAELRANELSQIQLNANIELLNAQNNAKARHDIIDAALRKELALYEGNADKQAEINAQIAANDLELFKARTENIEKWAARTEALLNGLNDLFNAIGERQSQKAQEEADAQKAILDDKLQNNLISQEEYDKQIEKIDADLAKKQAKIERENAIRERVIKAFSVITDTATGIMKAVAASPLTGGLPWSAIVGAMGAAQLATIAAAPLPKASRGKRIDGPSHSGGGVPIEAEGGEVIINKKSSSAFLPLLSAINEAGGGVPFVRPLSDGGFAARYAVSGGGLSRGEMTQAIHDGIKDLKIFTSVEDIRREDEKYVNIENRANF